MSFCAFWIKLSAAHVLRLCRNCRTTLPLAGFSSSLFDARMRVTQCFDCFAHGDLRKTQRSSYCLHFHNILGGEGREALR